jgi:hypothetical protein
MIIVISRAYITRVSIRTSPKITIKRMKGAPPGFLEIPSQALLMDLAWQKAPAAEARVMMAPPTIMESLNRGALSALKVSSWARRGTAVRKIKKKSKARGLRVFLIIPPF